MIFDYNPITGLNYYTFNQELFFINLECIEASILTKDYIKEWEKLVREIGIQVVDSTKPIIEEVFTPIYSNVPYEVFKERTS